MAAVRMRRSCASIWERTDALRSARAPDIPKIGSTPGTPRRSAHGVLRDEHDRDEPGEDQGELPDGSEDDQDHAEQHGERKHGPEYHADLIEPIERVHDIENRFFLPVRLDQDFGDHQFATPAVY
jgi:hypothetical protein